ncbi:MAG: hypothetical protein ABIQ84_04030, partial [Usitatibacter sp.]
MNATLIFTAMLPEHILLAGIVLLVLLEAVAGKPRAALAIGILTAASACAAALILSLQSFGAAPFPGHLSVDPSALLAKALVLALAIPVLLISRDEFAD